MSLLADNGPCAVLDAVRSEVNWMFGDWCEGQGIGTSDVGACIRNIIGNFGLAFEDLQDYELRMLHGLINNELCEMESV